MTMVDYGELLKKSYEIDKEVINFTKKYKRKLNREEFMKFFKKTFMLKDLRIAEERRLWKLALTEYRKK